ncbi:MAG: Zn-dependent hydrolase of the beta-lactamase fold-like protein [Mycobacterium sp.]|nr:Zn-dependent hydrolase of the beta-lactamase fold-like protein [Mycobacterium sp.]
MNAVLHQNFMAASSSPSPRDCAPARRERNGDLCGTVRSAVSGHREVATLTAGELAVTWLGHATTRIALDGLVFLTDPVLGRWVGPLRRSGPLPEPSSYTGVDVVLISHAHHDHLDLPSLRRLAPEVTVVAPIGLGAVIRRSGLTNVAELVVGEMLSFGSVSVVASPAVHPGNRWRSDVAASAMGYLITGSRSVYFAGDTGPDERLAGLRGAVDLALLPIGGWGLTLGPGHLDARQAAVVCAAMTPRAALPIHFGTLAVPTTRALRPLWARQRPELFAETTRRLVPDTLPLLAGAGVKLVVPSA